MSGSLRYFHSTDVLTKTSKLKLSTKLWLIFIHRFLFIYSSGCHVRVFRIITETKLERLLQPIVIRWFLNWWRSSNSAIRTTKSLIEKNVIINKYTYASLLFNEISRIISICSPFSELQQALRCAIAMVNFCTYTLTNIPQQLPANQKTISVSFWEAFRLKLFTQDFNITTTFLAVLIAVHFQFESVTDCSWSWLEVHHEGFQRR